MYSTIVDKTHMVFELNAAKLQRLHKFFIEPDWLQEPHVVVYDEKESANPFAVFEQIPPPSRYQFLLDNAHYVLMTFIRGPVCKGQVALNVIHDQFWIFFMDPEYDLAVRYPGFLQKHQDLLRMPTEQGSFLSLFESWLIGKYRREAARYVNQRQDYYGMSYRYQGLGPEAIWPGNTAEDSPVLTVFRHFNSAPVHKGVLGELPKTVWVMDYPLLERIYYSLVAGFDVYGSLGHQLAVRVYMDSLRQEGETYFLDFLPQDRRQQLVQQWYGGINPGTIGYQHAEIPAGGDFSTNDPKRELVEYLVRHRLKPETAIDFDENYLFEGEAHPGFPESYETENDYIRGFHAASAPATSFFNYVQDHDANLAYVHIKISEERSEVVSMVVHRWHDDFWDTYDWFQQEFLASDPLRAGVFDLNRYYSLAIELQQSRKNGEQPD